MPFSEYTKIARNTYTDTGIFDLDISAINLRIALPIGTPLTNTALNSKGADTIYIYARMRADDNPTALYEDGSEGVWYPLKGRIVCVSTVSDPTLISTTLDPIGDGLVFFPGSQLVAEYQGLDGVFVLIRNRQHPYDLSSACGLRINGFWKQRMG